VDGDFYRLLSPFEGNDTAWLVVSQDKTEAVVAFYQKLNKVNASWLRLKLDGLDKDMLYEVTYYSGRAGVKEEVVLKAYGDELMNMGLVLDRNELRQNGGDFASMLFALKRI
jgi:alpha-galactosidase